MPDASEETISAIEARVSGAEPVTTMMEEGMSPEDMLEYFLGELDLKINEKLPVRYSSIYKALGALKSFAEENSIYPTSVDVSDKGNLCLHFNDVTVDLGDGAHIERRLDVFKHIIYELLGRSGTLHLENYDGTQSRLIFSKNEKNS
jgi:hypothetical protein